MRSRIWCETLRQKIVKHLNDILDVMVFVIYSIVLALIAAPIYFLISPNIAGWFVWMTYGLISIYFFINSFTEYNSALKGAPKTAADVAIMAAYPFVTSIMGLVLIGLLFVDISKLHLLWLYPIVAIVFEMTIGKRAVDKTHLGPSKNRRLSK